MVRDYKNGYSDKFYKNIFKDFPFSFKYNGEEIKGFPKKDFTLLNKDNCSEKGKISSLYTYSFRNILTVKLLLTHYPSHGATEWTVFFKNEKDEKSGIISEMKTTLSFSGNNPELKGIMGDHVNQYRPYCENLTDRSISYVSDSGRATHITFPYFNLEYGNGGALLSVGWAGTWSAVFSSDGNKIHYTASSVINLHSRLLPGEEIRSALFTVIHYNNRNENYSSNLWRDWYIKYNLPPEDNAGKTLSPFSTSCLSIDTGRPNSDGSISETKDTWKRSLDIAIEKGINADFRWFDAGWYIAPDGSSPETDWWGTVGTWELDPVKWPGDSFRQSTDFAREHGMKTLMWFEPERVTDVENLAKNYGYNPRWAINVNGDRAVSNNIGDPECFKWTVDRICKTLRDNKVELYREDNNCDAAKLWAYKDEKSPDRTGITECKLIMGHYALWDKIIECTLSYGGCGFVDSCASGGGRNDLESMRRGIPLLRSDDDRTTAALRLSMTGSFTKWIPFCGAGSEESKEALNDPTVFRDLYVLRASYLPVFNISSYYYTKPEYDNNLIKKSMNEWKRLCRYLTCEFYTLTPWHSKEDKTCYDTFLYFDPETEKGVITSFRQDECNEDTYILQLPFKNGMFKLTDEDSGESFTLNSSEHATLHFPEKRTSKILWVEKI